MYLYQTEKKSVCYNYMKIPSQMGENSCKITELSPKMKRRGMDGKNNMQKITIRREQSRKFHTE